MITEKINNSTITQLITEKYNKIREIKKEKNFNKENLVNLWHYKKNLLQLGDEPEMKIYPNYSRQEAIMYCRKMIRKIKNLKENA